MGVVEVGYCSVSSSSCLFRSTTNKGTVQQASRRHVLNSMQHWQPSNTVTHTCCDVVQGRDHIWLATHDEGACWFPTEVYNNSIILTHWGRMDVNHTSNTAYELDNYSTVKFDNYSQHLGMGGPDSKPISWTELTAGHACYTPGKVICWHPSTSNSSSPATTAIYG